MTELSFDDAQEIRLADNLIEKPLLWSRSSPAPSSTPVLSFVKFRAFDRATKQYCSIVQLLRSGQWEDALVLARSLYELNMNLSEINCSSDREQAARKFVRFGKFQQLRLEQRRAEDQLRDENLEPKPCAQTIAECEQKLTAIASTLNREFGEFRGSKGKKWQDSWSGLSVETLAEHLAKATGGQRGQSDYFVFKLGSLFTHNTPASLFLTLRRDPEAADWKRFRESLEDTGRKGLREFLREASMCLVDIIGIAGDSIAGYERPWFDDFALPLLEKF